jgi:hypothetical protein
LLLQGQLGQTLDSLIAPNNPRHVRRGEATHPTRIRQLIEAQLDAGASAAVLDLSYAFHAGSGGRTGDGQLGLFSVRNLDNEGHPRVRGELMTRAQRQ